MTNEEKIRISDTLEAQEALMRGDDQAYVNLTGIPMALPDGSVIEPANMSK